MLTWPQTILLAIYHYRRSLLIGSVALSLWWTFLPSDDEFDLVKCEPYGSMGQISAWVHGSSFWRTQLPMVNRNLVRAQNWDSDYANSKAQELAAVAQVNAWTEIFYAQHPESAPSFAQRQAEKLRAAADAIEQAETNQIVSVQMHARAVAIATCQAKILDMK